MIRKRLSVGAQTFQFFHNENLIYVDKTEKIYELMQLGIHNFIVRPRRFGKSLLLDTIAAIYEGRKEQFEGTWIYDKIDWEAIQRPTLRIDFTAISYDAIPLEQGLINYLMSLAAEMGIPIHNQSAKDMFRDIIKALSKDKSIVVLIDEYETAVTDFVGEDEAKLNENIKTLKKILWHNERHSQPYS